jgi:hypothetical protein
MDVNPADNPQKPAAKLFFANTRSASSGGEAFLRRCPFLALSVQQGAANGSKGWHKAKPENRSILAATMPDPAASSTPRQRAAIVGANVAFEPWLTRPFRDDKGDDDKRFDDDRRHEKK